MESGVRNTLLGIAAFISVILGLMLASVINPRPMSNEEAAKLGYYRFDEPRLISEFLMTDHLGRRVGLADLKTSLLIAIVLFFDSFKPLKS